MTDSLRLSIFSVHMRRLWVYSIPLMRKSFQEKKDFWEALSEEEYQHSSWIRSLEEYAAKGEFLFTDKFKEAPVKISIKYVLEQKERAKGGKVPEREALSMAYSIENSSSRKGCF